MALDKTVLETARRHLHDGDALKALALIKGLTPDAETVSDCVTLLFAQATCYARLNDIDMALDLVATTKEIVRGDRQDLSQPERPGLSEAERLTLSQLELLEATLYANRDQYDRACELFASMKVNYSDLLAADKEFAAALDSRIACALVEAKRYDQAIPIFRTLLERPEVENKQRLQVSFGIALLCTGHRSEAQSAFFSAVMGDDDESKQMAWKYLAEFETDQ